MCGYLREKLHVNHFWEFKGLTVQSHPVPGLGDWLELPLEGKKPGLSGDLS